MKVPNKDIEAFVSYMGNGAIKDGLWKYSTCPESRELNIFLAALERAGHNFPFEMKEVIRSEHLRGGFCFPEVRNEHDVNPNEEGFQEWFMWKHGLNREKRQVEECVDMSQEAAKAFCETLAESAVEIGLWRKASCQGYRSLMRLLRSFEAEEVPYAREATVFQTVGHMNALQCEGGHLTPVETAGEAEIWGLRMWGAPLPDVTVGRERGFYGDRDCVISCMALSVDPRSGQMFGEGPSYEEVVEEHFGRPGSPTWAECGYEITPFRIND